MSKHTLSGIDFTNGARVNQTFDLSDNPIYGNVFEKDSNKKKNNTEKVDTFVKKVESQSPYEKLSEAYGGIEKLPVDYKPVKGVTSPLNLYSLISSDKPKQVVETNFKVKGLKPNEEIRIVPGTEKDPKYFKIDKNAPGLNTLGNTFAGIVDALSGQTLDLDKTGKSWNVSDHLYIKDNLIDIKDPANYELSKVEENLINRELETQGIDTVEEDATSGVDGATTESIEQQKKQSKFERGERLKDALQVAGYNFAALPIYNQITYNAARKRLELDKAMLGAREMMPSNIQNIMASKQAQRSLASSAFAEELKAVAAQQDAATQFAGLGMQRSFGQPNPTSFRV